MIWDTMIYEFMKCIRLKTIWKYIYLRLNGTVLKICTCVSYIDNNHRIKFFLSLLKSTLIWDTNFWKCSKDLQKLKCIATIFCSALKICQSHWFTSQMINSITSILLLLLNLLWTIYINNLNQKVWFKYILNVEIYESLLL